MEVTDDASPYDVLGIAPDASPEDVRAAYLRAVRTAHPDMGGSAERFTAVADAWAVLGSRESRALYDARGARGDAWGDDVGFDVPFDHAAAQAPVWTGSEGDEPGPGPGPAPGPTPEARPGPAPTRDPEPAAPVVVDPLCSRPLPLPVRPWRLPDRSAERERTGHRVLVLCAGVPAAVVAMLPFRDGHPLPVGPAAITGLAEFGMVFGAGVIATLFCAPSARPARRRAAWLMWGSLAVFVAYAILFVDVGRSGTPAGRALMVGTVFAGALALAVHATVLVRRERAATRARDAADPWKLAARWDELLRSRATERGWDRDVVGRTDPRTGEARWELVIDGVVVAAASDAALGAWVDLQRGAGHDVARPVVG